MSLSSGQPVRCLGSNVQRVGGEGREEVGWGTHQKWSQDRGRDAVIGTWGPVCDLVSRER